MQGAEALALRYSPMILQGQQDVAAAAARIKRSDAGSFPSVSATLFGSRSSWSNILSTPDATPPVNFMGIPPGNFLDQNITAMLPIYTGGRVAAASRAAQADQAASASDLDTTLQDVVLQTRISYRKVIYERSLLGAQEQNLAAAQEQLRTEELRYEAGKNPAYTVYRARTQVANAQQDQTNAYRDWRKAHFDLDTVLGISLASNIALSDGLERLPPAPAPNTVSPLQSSQMPFGGAELQPLLDAAIANRPELRAAQQRTESASARVVRARAAYRPQINLMGMGDLTRGGAGTRNGLNYTLGFAAGVPIFEGGALSAAEHEAAAALRKAQAAEGAELLQVNSDVGAAWLNRAAARQNLTTMQTGLQQAQEDYVVQQLRYSAGKGIQLDLLNALAALTKARVGLEQARFEHSVAQDQLRRATGTLAPPSPKIYLTPGPSP
ncbi:MAG: TolC family protein [Armatimonadota bacterium]|nr:TolC family protein [Armatimonadota bacterium]